MFEIRLPRAMTFAIMKCVVCTGLFSSLALAEEHSEYEPVVAIDHEPQHRLVLATAALRVFDVSFPPGAVSLWHLHEKDSVLLCLDGANVPSEEPGKPAVDRPPIPSGEIYYRPYGQQPFVHRIRNVDRRPFRILDIEVLAARQASKAELDPLDGTWSVVIDNDRVRVVKRAIRAGAATPPVRFRGAHLVVALTDGTYAIESGDAAGHRLHVRRGDVHADDAGGEVIMRNLGSSDVELAIIEVK